MSAFSATSGGRLALRTPVRGASCRQRLVLRPLGIAAAPPRAESSAAESDSGASRETASKARLRQRRSAAPVGDAPRPAPAAPPPEGADTGSDRAQRLERAASNRAATTSEGGPVPGSRSKSFQSSWSGARGATASGGFNVRAFTTELAAARTVADLQGLFEVEREQQLTPIHVATVWTRLAKLASPARFADAEAPPAVPTEPAALAAFVEALEAATTAEQLSAMEGRGLASVVWAAAKLEACSEGGAAPASPKAEQPALRAPASEPAGSGAGAAEDTTGGADAGAARARTRGGRGAKAKAAAAAAAAAEAEAAAAAESLRARRLVSQSLLDRWAVAASSKMATLNAHDVSNIAWALGRLGYQPPGLFMNQLSIIVFKFLPTIDRPQQLSNTLLGLALLRYVPPVKDFWPRTWDALGRVVLRDQQAPDVQGVTNTLWSLSHLLINCPDAMPVVPADLVSKAVFRAVQWGDRMLPVQCQDLFTSLPRLGFQPSEYQASKLLALAQRVLPAADAQALSNIYMATVQLRVRPSPAWMAPFLRAFRQQLPGASPEALARLLFGLAASGRRPPPWMQEVWAKVGRELPAFQPADVAFTVLAISMMFPKLAKQHALPQLDAQDGSDSSSTGTSGSSGSGAPGAEEEAQEERAASSSVAAGAPDGMALPPPAAPARAARVAAAQPPRELLVALRGAWEGFGSEAQRGLVLSIRADVSEFLNAALP